VPEGWLRLVTNWRAKNTEPLTRSATLGRRRMPGLRLPRYLWPLTPLDRLAGGEPVYPGGDRRHIRGDSGSQTAHRRYLPCSWVHPRIIARTAATDVRMVHPQSRFGLEPQRAYLWRPPGSGADRDRDLGEAVEMSRTLWKGYTAPLYSAWRTRRPSFSRKNSPEELPWVYIASEGPISASLVA
jgi:hypothetical protein